MNIPPLVAGLLAILLAAAPRIAHGAYGEVLDELKITPSVFLQGPPDSGDFVGWSTAWIGDLDGDDFQDMAVGALFDDDGASSAGAVWILFLNFDGSVRDKQKISATEGGFTGTLDTIDRFGASIAALGDLDNDGTDDLAVGADWDDDGFGDAGAVYILFMNPDGTVSSQQKISATAGGFGAGLAASDHFGSALAPLNDLDADGVEDVAVGALGDDDGGFGAGSVWILFLNANGTVKSKQLISETSGGFGGALDGADEFGDSLAAINIGGSSLPELAVGAPGDDDGGSGRGAIWMLFLNANGTVSSQQKISDLSGTFDGTLANGDSFGGSVANIHDRDGDTVRDLAVGAFSDNDGGANQGAVWVLYMNSNGTVKNEKKISETAGSFFGPLDPDDRFGTSVAMVGAQLAVGTTGDDDGFPSTVADPGAVWMLGLDANEDVTNEVKLSAISGNLPGFDPADYFGSTTSAIGDVNGDGVTDLAAGVPYNSDGAPDAGAVWLLFMNEDGSVGGTQKISAVSGGFGGALQSSDAFGTSVASLGDLDGDAVPDIAVGARYHDAVGALDCGAIWILFLNSDGTVESEQKITHNTGGFGSLGANAWFGTAVTALGDLDGDGVTDLAVGASGDLIGVQGGVFWVVFLNANGTAKDAQLVGTGVGGFVGPAEQGDGFGSALAAIGDLDGDGVNDVAAGAWGDEFGGEDTGMVWILFLNEDGTVESEVAIGPSSGGFGGTIGSNSLFGTSLSAVGDLDGDGVSDLMVGAPGDSDGGSFAGAVWTVFLDADGSVKDEIKISETSGGFGGALDSSDSFGSALTSFGDLDGDGRPEIAVGASGDDDVGSNSGAVWLLSLDAVPTINFDPPIEILAAGAGDFVATGDFDSDGDDDAVLVIPGTNPLVAGHVQVFINQGTDSTGGWFGFVANPAIEVGLQPSGVAVGHLDSDEHLDLAVTNAGDGNVTILLNTGAGDGTFMFDVNVTVGLAPQGIAAANLNGTGFDDVAVANAGSDNVMILTNTTALATTWLISATIPVGDEPVALEPEDVDNDKDLDLVVANRSGGTATILLLSSGAPGSSQTVSIGGAPVAVATGDIDESGFADIAVANEADDVVALVPNEGSGVFGAAEPVTVGVAPESVELVDLDGDGDPDLAVVAQDSTVGPAVQVLENLGPTVGPLGPALVEFGPPVGHSVEADPNYVVSADIDEDDRIDLVTANNDPGGPTGGSISVLLNLACPADMDSSGDVGFGDVTAFLLNWGVCPAPPANCPWDLDHDDTIGFNDLTLLLLQWGVCE